MLISQNKDQYFFPYIKTEEIIRVNPKISSSIIFKGIRKIFWMFKLPCCKFIIGDWVSLIPTIDKIIIMDSGYITGMKKYFKKINDKCDVNLFLWNHVNDYTYIIIKDFNDKEKTWTFVEEDSKKYGIKLNTTFYTKDIQLECNSIEHDLLFVGREKGKAKDIISIAKELKNIGIMSKIHLIRSGIKYSEEIDKYLTDEFMEYNEYLKLISKSSILLDYNEPNNFGLSMRVLESLFFRKKLITNNVKIKKELFYNENNIFIIDESKDNPFKGILNFVRCKYQDVDDGLLNYYSLEQWIDRFN